MPTNMARAYAGGKFGLELDEKAAGWVHNASGGHAYSDIVNEKVGADHVVKKHLGNVKYEEITVETGTGMSKSFYAWLKDSFEAKYSRKSGAIVSTDYNAKVMSRKEFTHALITEIGLPALDASSKDAAKMTVKFTPEITRIKSLKDGVSWKFGDAKAIQKKWLPANFRLKIDDGKLDCSRVNKIGELVVRQKNVEHAVGEMRDYQREPALLEIPNLVVTTSESHADTWYQWHEDFVIKGNCDEGHEKSGKLEYLSPNLQEVLFTLTLKNMGIFKLEEEKQEAHSENIRRVKAQLYVESMDLDFGAAVGA